MVVQIIIYYCYQHYNNKFRTLLILHVQFEWHRNGTSYFSCFKTKFNAYILNYVEASYGKFGLTSVQSDRCRQSLDMNSSALVLILYIFEFHIKWNKRPTGLNGHLRLYTDFLFDFLGLIFVYQQPHHRISN